MWCNDDEEIARQIQEGWKGTLTELIAEVRMARNARLENGSLRSIGTPGPRSRTMPDLGPPDLVRTVRCSIAATGYQDSPVQGPATSSLWRRDALGGFTIMLSSDCLTSAELESLERLHGDLGSTALVALRFERTTPS